MALAVVGATRGSYIGAVASAAAAVFITSMVPALEQRSTFLLALSVVILSAWKSGWRVGAAAAATSFVLIAALMPPHGGWISRTGDDVLRFATFAGLIVAVILFARAREMAGSLWTNW